jgi:F420-dependent oxidoreductase-like protein
MRVGVVVPQGWVGEYHGVEPASAWARTVAVAKSAEQLGFDSIWVFDHFQTVDVPTDDITFESFTVLSALAALTKRVRLGHLVLCAGYRNAALVSKMISTVDVISGGRAELGIGAGWKEDEFRAYGYGFPPLAERLAALEENLEVITRMLGPGRATYAGRQVSVGDAINVPKGLQTPRVPVIVGGNGPQVTWRLASRFANELNLDSLTPAEVRAALPVIRQRCEEVGRDPASLKVSIHAWWDYLPGPGQARIDTLAAYRELGLARLMTLLPASAEGDEAIAVFAEEALEAGCDLDV